jgi:ABC-type nitrate/sulfonate/bicarbonate transport system substrate-binding protein
LRQGPSVIAASVLAAASVLSLAALEAQPRDRTRVAAIFPPWTSAEHAMAQVAQSGGRIVRAGLIDAIVVVQGDDANLVDRLYAAGAWAVVDPSAWGGCLAGQPAHES